MSIPQRQQLAITDGKKLPENYLADLDKGFSDADIAIYEKHGFPLPSKVFKTVMKDDQYLAKILKETGDLNSKLGGIKGNWSKKGSKKKNEAKIVTLSQEIDSIKKYNERIKGFNEGKKMTGKGCIPQRRTLKIGSGIVYYNNPEDLMSRMELLGGSIRAGNNSVKDEFSTIAHKLSQLGVLSNDQLINLLGTYVM